MKDRHFWLAVVSAFIATQHNTGEAALATDQKHSVKVNVSVVEEEAVTALFAADNYEQVIETAGAAWPRLEAMPERVLYCVSESSIRLGHVQAAKNGFELLVAKNPQKHSYRAGLAYTQLYAGELEKGLSMYHQVLLENPGMLKIAAEDAVALLSQGNIGGGKALFQMVIEISPDRQHYLQWYERSLHMYRIADDSPVQGTDQTAVVQLDAPAKNESKMLHTQAVELARNEQYRQSLEIMNRLFTTNPKDKTIVSDYITILQWAGQNEQAVSLYEQQSDTDLPLYVVKSLSNAYFSLKQYDKALNILQPAITQGERDALLRAGEMLLLRGDRAGAQVYYERLFAKNPSDYEAYLSRGLLSMQAKDYQQAAGDLERARRLMPDGAGKATDLLKVEHNLAIAYMNLGQNKKAVTILESYTKTLPVEGSLASDYIIALGRNSQNKLAVQEGERLWPGYIEAPVLGLRSLAESYIWLGQQEQALAIYRHLAERQPGDSNGLRMLAFQLMLNGHTTEGLGHYTQILDKSPANVDSVVEDAVTFINTDQYIAGKMLFELVLAKYPKKSYRSQYAEVLVKKQLYHSAARQYQLLSAQSDGELAGLSGMVRTAIAMGDYEKLRQALDNITRKYGRSKAVAALASTSTDDWKSGNEKAGSADTGAYKGKNSKVLSTAQSRGKQEKITSTSHNNTGIPVAGKAKETFTYEMTQFATKFLAAPVADAESFKIEFAYAISSTTAKVMPIIPNDQRNEFAYEMALITSHVINDQNLNVKDAKTQFAQLTTKVINHIDEFTTTDEKAANLQKSDKAVVKAVASSVLDPATYTGLIDGLLEVGNRSKHIDHKINIDGEIRYHYAINTGAPQWDNNVSGIRTYLGADSRINKDWHAYSMLEGQKSFLNYNNFLNLSRLYVMGKVGTAKVTAGLFGYTMAEGNIYDSGFTGVMVDFGDLVKYTLSYGKTNDTKATYTASARYNYFDYNLEAGMYHYKMNGTDNPNTIWTASGKYKFNDFSLGAMYLKSSQKDSNGNNNGYVFSVDYGELHSYRPGTYNLYAKYYNQSKDTYIAHGMDGRASSMQGMKGYGLGVNYTLAKDVVMGVEYYDLTDKISKEKGKTLWAQVTYYF